jgi:type IV pilus assembly protein PilC
MAKVEKQPQFTFVARRMDGSIQEGKFLAPSKEAVNEYLIAERLVPIEIKPAATGLQSEISFSFMKGRVKRRDIAQWARQMSIMIDAGLDLLQILDILAEQTENKTLAEVSLDIKKQISNGVSLGEAMSTHVDIFDELIVSMVLAGSDEAGALDKTFRQISKDLDAEVKLRAKIKSAMTYPVVVLIMAILLCGGMLLFIVPVFDELFSSMGGQLPLPTRILVNLSNFLKVGAIPIVIAFVIFIAWWRKNKREMWIRNRLDPIKVRMPVFGKLNKKIVIARFARNLSTLQTNGVPILSALTVVEGTVGNVLVSRALTDMKTDISRGNQMSESMTRHEIFPPMVTQMVAVGEKAGAPDTMLIKIADDYDEQVETTTEQLASLIEPFMIAFLGILVGGMVIALYLPIFSVYDLIQ